MENSTQLNGKARGPLVLFSDLGKRTLRQNQISYYPSTTLVPSPLSVLLIQESGNHSMTTAGINVKASTAVVMIYTGN